LASTAPLHNQSLRLAGIGSWLLAGCLHTQRVFKGLSAAPMRVLDMASAILALLTTLEVPTHVKSHSVV